MTRRTKAYRRPAADHSAVSRLVLRVLNAAPGCASMTFSQIRDKLPLYRGRSLDNWEISEALTYCTILKWVCRYYEWYYITESGRDQLRLYNIIN